MSPASLIVISFIGMATMVVAAPGKHESNLPWLNRWWRVCLVAIATLLLVVDSIR